MTLMAYSARERNEAEIFNGCENEKLMIYVRNESNVK